MAFLDPLAILAVLAAVGALGLGARWFVGAASRLATAAGISPLVVGLTVVAFGTSAPEFAVTIEAAMEGRPELSVGNVIGSNVFNLGIILGSVALLRPFAVAESFVRRDALAMGGATLLAIVLVVDGSVGRAEGALLVAGLLAYLGWLIAAGRAPAGSNPEPPAEGDGGIDLLDLGRLIVGIALVVAGGQLLVGTAADLARTAGISEWAIGVTVVAAGTSVPELATSIVAARRGEVAIAAGNVVGSNVFNLLGVLGVAAVVHPLSVASDPRLGLAVLLALTAVATALLATGRRLTRPEGGLLVCVAVSYWILDALLG
nr:calcium/sodium antiporter [Saliphagus sp. LR7]